MIEGERESRRGKIKAESRNKSGVRRRGEEEREEEGEAALTWHGAPPPHTPCYAAACDGARTEDAWGFPAKNVVHAAKDLKSG